MRISDWSSDVCSSDLSQLSIAIHVGDPIDLEWSEPGSDRLRVTRIEPGMAHINPGDNPFFQRWRGSPELLIVAFDQAMIDRVGTEIFGKVGAMLRPTVGSVDRNIRNALDRKSDVEGKSGSVRVESGCRSK